MRSAGDISLDEVETTAKTALDLLADKIQELDAELDTPYDDLELFARAMRFLGGTRVLDVGCGWARYVKVFIEQGFAYTGIDLSPKMLEVARRLNPTLDFREMSFRKLDFPDASFDGLWCCCALGYGPKRNMHAVFAEFARVLVPRGVLHIIMPYTDFGEEYVAPFANNMDIEGYYALWDKEEMADEIKRAGFTISESRSRLLCGTLIYLAHK